MARVLDFCKPREYISSIEHIPTILYTFVLSALFQKHNRMKRTLKWWHLLYLCRRGLSIIGNNQLTNIIITIKYWRLLIKRMDQGTGPRLNGGLTSSWFLGQSGSIKAFRSTRVSTSIPEDLTAAFHGKPLLTPCARHLSLALTELTSALLKIAFERE